MSTEFNYQTIETGYYDRIFHKRKGPQSKWHWQKFEIFKDLIQQAGLPQGAKLLDIACGPGTFVGLLDSRIDATGVDIAESQIAYASKHYRSPNKNFIKLDSPTLPFEDNRFDVVTAIELIEHLTPEQVQTVLDEARRVLKPGGRLMISTPNYHSGWPLLEIIVNRVSELSYEDQHINKFHRGKLRKLLQSLGFHQIQVKAFQGIAPFSAALSWEFADRLLGLERMGPANIYGFLLLGIAQK